MCADAPRQRLDLAGKWQLAFDSDNRGKSEGWMLGRFPVAAELVPVPSVWNLVRPGYEGVAFYRRHCDVPSHWHDRRVNLVVAAANYQVECWVNGQYAGAHEGGYTPFALDLTALLKYGSPNEVVLRVVDPPFEGEVDGLRLAEIACAKETWYYRYGGLWGDIALETHADMSCADLFICPEPNGRQSATAFVTLANERRTPAETALTLHVTGADGGTLAHVDRKVMVKPGQTEVTLPLDIPQALRWSPAQPQLCQCHCELHNAAGELLDSLRTEFGLRTCEMAGGEFRLDAAPIILKGVLYQPNYPRTLVYPPTPTMAEEELRLIKDAGFNLVRFHIRPPHPCYLALADRLGLLVYEETALAWIAPGPNLAARGRRELRETIRRDRNHASIVLWGIFNENRAATQAVGADLLAYARELDPSRPVIDNSGGTAAIGQGSWWIDATRILPVAARVPVPLNDLHLYFGAPMAPQVGRWLRRAGGGAYLPDLTRHGYATRTLFHALHERLNGEGRLFVSELGFGGLPDLGKVAAAFDVDGPLVDVLEVRAYRDSLIADLAARDLTGRLGGISGVASFAQGIQAHGDVRQVEALRCNPRVAGYVVTQFNDAAWEFHAGLVDLWRQPKRALAALAAANQPRHLVLSLPHHVVFAGQPLRFATTLVDETSLVGKALMQIALLGDDGRLRQRSSTMVRISNRIAPLRVPSLAAPSPAGQYTLQASIQVGAEQIASATETVLVLETFDWRELAAGLGGSVALASPDRRIGNRIGLPVAAPSAGQRFEPTAILVTRPAALAIGDWQGLAKWVRGGGKAIIGELSPTIARRAGRGLGLPLEASGSLGCFMGYFHYVKRSAPFHGLPADCLADDEYANVLPRYSLNELGGTVFAGCFSSTRDAGGHPGFFWLADVQSVTLGRGWLVFSQYRIVESLGRDAVADTLLRNLLRMVQA